MRYHVVVTGSRPEKGSDNKYLPLPKENREFIEKTLALLPAKDYVALYHGAAAGVDQVADDYAFENGIRVKQFPAYWFNPTKPNNVDKGAGLFRNERMLRTAKDAVYGKDPNTEMVILLAFHSKPLAESKGTNHCVTTAEKIGLTVRTYELPVQASTPNTTASAETSNAVPF